MISPPISDKTSISTNIANSFTGVHVRPEIELDLLGVYRKISTRDTMDSRKLRDRRGLRTLDPLGEIVNVRDDPVTRGRVLAAADGQKPDAAELLDGGLELADFVQRAAVDVAEKTIDEVLTRARFRCIEPGQVPGDLERLGVDERFPVREMADSLLQKLRRCVRLGVDVTDGYIRANRDLAIRQLPKTCVEATVANLRSGEKRKLLRSIRINR
jgi:hypothetical protein